MKDKMDKAKEKERWAWLPAQMPKVAELMASQRQALGPEHVARCWYEAVHRLQPGWFYARQGALAVGVPWHEIADAVMAPLQPDQAMVWLKAVEKADAAH